MSKPRFSRTISMRHAGIGAAATVGLLLSACAAPAPMLQDTNASGQGPVAESELEGFYEQRIDWERCGINFTCGSVTVPIDYSNPDAGTIDIALKKYAEQGADGEILINPGGPGGSGIETVEAARQVFTTELRAAKEIIGFDPRGVGQSAPITCLDAKELDELGEKTYDVETRDGWDAFLADTAAYYESCRERNPEVIGFVDTVSSARDMDIIRAALGTPTLDYLGFSYGTKLGATYAELFGNNVGQFVLDGAVDLTLGHRELARGQVEGFEGSFRAFLDDCLGGPTCPFLGNVDTAYEDVLGMMDDLELRPVETEDPERPVTDVDLMNTIILTLYSTENWGLLSAAISDLQQGDADLVRLVSDIAMEREEDGTYAPGDGAMSAIDCLDIPIMEEPDWSELRQMEQEYEEISALFGPSLAYAEVGCAVYPIKSSYGPQALAAADAPTMIVIGTTQDPATPYEWSEAMAEQLADAVLLTREGFDHTAYGKGSCIDEAVDDFFIRGILPADGLSC